MKNILLISSERFPIPPVRGSAPQELMWNGLIEFNETVSEPVHFTVLSPYDAESERISKTCKRTDFRYYKFPKILKKLDSFLSFFLKKRLNREIFHFQGKWLRNHIKKFLRKNQFDELVMVETNVPLWPLRDKKAYEKYKGHYWYHALSEPNPPREDIKEVYEHLSGIISASDFIRKKFESFKNVHCPKTYVLRNFIDHKIFCPKDNASMREKYGISPSDFVMLFAGRLVEIKGADKVILAFKEILKEKPNSKLVIVGSNFTNNYVGNTFGEKVMKLVSDIQDKVIFTGYIKHPDMGEAYSLADVVVLPSVCQEGAGLTMIESMACQKAVITTHSGGIPEYVGDAAIVLPLDEHLVENIAANVIRLQDHPEELKKLSAKGYERAKEFTKERFYNTFIDIVTRKGDHGDPQTND